ncbi:dihydroxyacetone kinase phosphoryl donor subunit DhaM [Sphingobium nicotianae]|uniref:phosphoenolpyruvate--glycerone phosphotransferase n=1 Tax=Sphingobium nicotianae TaxID=2782607 RepID=A0A9X1DF74_9SPHN|nr:dihydroxyacetone kinase phosphoryl donor subunit DhaM [Sphingobium nicotianae]MBT2189100.1 PTS-dependent dihydroxyacetone kinase phosphotransferase subunit DhaM [Sphingobium nicotianae]
MTVAILIVSHSVDVARGTAEMARRTAGPDLAIGWTGGNPAGGLGTSMGAIAEQLDAIWGPDGVAILVDVGGAETNSEMAVEEMAPDKAKRVRICQAPLVEGAIMAAAEAASGGTLDQVVSAAEEVMRG